METANAVNFERNKKNHCQGFHSLVFISKCLNFRVKWSLVTCTFMLHKIGPPLKGRLNFSACPVPFP